MTAPQETQSHERFLESARILKDFKPTITTGESLWLPPEPVPAHILAKMPGEEMVKALYDLPEWPGTEMADHWTPEGARRIVNFRRMEIHHLYLHGFYQED